jgi:aspartate racemase
VAPALSPPLGILGGMGPRATHYFVGELLDAAERMRPTMRDQDYPDFVVHYACSNHDRTQAILDDNGVELRETLLAQLSTLRGLGCQQLVVPCLSAHAVLDPIPKDIPLLDLRRATCERLAADADAPLTVALLATRGTNLSVRRGAWSWSSDVNVQPLDVRDEETLMSLIYDDLKRRGPSESATSTLLSICDRLHDAGAARVVAACTEVEMCLASGRPHPPYVVLPLREAAMRLVPCALAST